MGLDLCTQRALIRESWKIFLKNGVKPTVFMAPSHSFDLITLEALKLETDIRLLTDGYAFYPFFRSGFIWLPQQLWRFRNFWWGIWTICFHPNHMNESEIRSAIFDIRKYSKKITSVNEVLKSPISRWGLFNIFIELAYIGMLRARRLLKNARNSKKVNQE